MKRGWLPFAAAALAVAGVAHADVVGPPPDDCPDGSEGQSCHGGPYCAPDVCTSDADCGAGESCTELQACMGSVICAGMLPPDANIEDYRVDTLEGFCADGTCASGECRTVRLCRAAGSPGGGGSDDGGCGCHATAPGATTGVLPLGVAAFALLILLRRRV